MKKGILLIVSGLSGAGKGTICNRLMEKYPQYALSISATSRKPRVGETDGKEYFFISKEEFEARLEKGLFLEHAQYVGNYYGTPRSFVEKQLGEGKDVILEIEYMGAFKVKEKYPEAVLVFLCPPSVEEVYKRLKGRNTETEEVILKRIARGKEEADIIDKYDYLVINDDLEECALDLHNTIQSARNASFLRGDFINELKQEFDVFLKNN